MSFQVTGSIHLIEAEEQVSPTFRKRRFVISFAENPSYPQLIPFECTQQRCELLDSYSVGDTVEVHFNLKGREWLSPKGEKKYFLTLDVWKVQAPQTHTADSYGTVVSAPSDQEMAQYDADDLPF